MIRRSIPRDKLAKDPYLAWNAFVDLLTMEGYADLDTTQRVAYLAFWYDSEVQNGGHLQYFENGGTGMTQATLDALSHLGAHDQRSVLARAAELYSRKIRSDIRSVEQYVDEALKGEFDAADGEYHSCEPSITELLERYLESHKDSFITEA